MTQGAGQLDKQTLEAAVRDALKSVLGGVGPGANPRMEFYNKFQREMEEHDRDFEKKYDEDLNTTLIFSGLFSAVTSAFIIDVQSELKPDYEEMNNRLLEMLLNATTGTLPVGSAAPVPRWPGADPVIVQVQCILYATLCATLLASFLAMLGKQWLNRYRQNETHGSAVDRSRARERKLNGIETWRFHIVMESLPVILQCALVLLGFALSRYLWGISHSVSSVVIGFTSFGFFFYLLIVTASISSFDCPFQTPFSLLVRFMVVLAAPYWHNLQQTLRTQQQPPQPEMLGMRRYLPLSMNAVGRGHGLEASVGTHVCMVPTAMRHPWPVTPLFVQEIGLKSDGLDARCISRMFAMSIDADVVSAIMDFIPEIIWHGGIKDVPLKRIYSILMDCFDFLGPSPVVIPKLQDVAYLSARAFVHIELQRRCITQCEEHKQDSWKTLCANHPLLSPTDYGLNPDLEAILLMVDMTLGYDNGFPWERMQMTPPHRARMSHVFLYRAWHEGRVSEVVTDFVENSMSLRLPSDIVITDCLFIIGLMIGIPFHVSDITVRDKSREKRDMLDKVFEVLSMTFGKSLQTPLTLRALWLVTRLAEKGVSDASYALFTMIVASERPSNQHWEVARLAIYGAFQSNIVIKITPARSPELDRILKFLNYHLGLQVAGEDHRYSIIFALEAIVRSDHYPTDPTILRCLRDFIRDNPSFMRGMRSTMQPHSPYRLRLAATGLTALTSGQLFDPALELEMSQFSEHLAAFIIDDHFHGEFIQRCSVIILFGMLHSPEWREHIASRFWRMLSYCILVDEELESFKWCLQNAIKLLEFTRGLPDGEGLKWWYVTLWFHYDKLDTTVRDEVERIAKDMSVGDGLSDLDLNLSLIGQEVTKIRQEVDEVHKAARPDMPGAEHSARLRLVALEGNYNRLARIIGGR